MVPEINWLKVRWPRPFGVYFWDTVAGNIEASDMLLCRTG